MFNRKAKEIAWLSGRLEVVSIEKENFQALASTYWDTAAGLADDVKNLTNERNQWKSFGERWSKRYDDLAAMRPNEARFTAAVEVQTHLKISKSSFRDFIPAIEGLEALPAGVRAITEAGAKAVGNLPSSIAIGTGHIIDPDL